jgi:tellurite methyltransferase
MIKKFYTKKKNYWDNYYKDIKKSFYKFKPSSFAIFIKNKYLDKSINLLEIGCGNARDTFFFYNRVHNIIAVDSSLEAVKKNKKIARTNKLKIKFLNMNFEKINYNQFKKINFVYLRFFLHTITLKKENMLIKVFKKILKKNINTLFALEFRTSKDELMSIGKKISKYERYTDHYRRFINVKEFINKLKRNNFKVIYFNQGINLSKTKFENPHLCRLVFKNA